MNPVPASVKATAFAQVNLLPPEVGQRRAAAKQRTAMLAVFGLFVVVIAGLYAVVTTAKQDAIDGQLEEESKAVPITAELTKFSEVEAVEARLRNAQTARLYAAGTEVILAEFWPELLASFPDDVIIESVAQNLMTLGGSSSLDGTLFSNADVGSISFTVVAPTYDSAARIEDELNASDFLDFARVDSIAIVAASDNPEGATTPGVAPAGSYRMSGVARVNFLAFSQRFSPAWFGTEEAPGTAEDYEDYLDLLDATVVTPEPSAEPTVEPTPSPDAQEEDNS